MRDRSGPDASRSGAALAPRARVTELVITESRDEVLVYDQAVHHIHHLNRISAVIWRLCDGQRSMTDLVQRVRLDTGEDVDDAVVRLALTKLDEANLLDQPLPGSMRVSTTTRRSLVKRAALASAIVSISAPSAAAADSHCSTVAGSVQSGCPCTYAGQCASGQCNTPWFNGSCV